MSTTAEAVQLHSTVVRSIRDHSQREDAKGGFEAVGFMAARPETGIGVAVLPMHNHAADPTCAFFVEPWEQFQGENALKDKGYMILGIYHSHPRSEALPSKADHAMAWPGGVMAIFSVLFDELKLYREQDNRLTPIGLMEV